MGILDYMIENALFKCDEWRNRQIVIVPQTYATELANLLFFVLHSVVFHIGIIGALYISNQQQADVDAICS